MENNDQEVVCDKTGKTYKIINFKNDYIGAKLGFWLFLFTEFMLFGIMFLIFAYYFYLYSEDFVSASTKLNLTLGSINTILLLISTYFMGTSLVNIKNNNIQKTKRNIYITIVISIIFLTIKYFEWMTEINHGIYPDSTTLNEMSKGIGIYFGLYFTMSGLHGLHIIIGIIIMLFILRKISKKEITQRKYIYLENTALYWDFVHIVWVFLFPLFYMIGA